MKKERLIPNSANTLSSLLKSQFVACPESKTFVWGKPAYRILLAYMHVI